jgi:hypothetical protein
MTLTNNSGQPIEITSIVIDVGGSASPTFTLSGACTPGGMACSQDTITGTYVITATGSVLIANSSSVTFTFPGGFTGAPGSKCFNILITSNPQINPGDFQHCFTVG